MIQFNTHQFKLITITHKNALLTGCPVKRVHIISQKVLTDNLRSMEEDGLILRTVYPEVPPRVEYSLSSLGESLKPILDSMADWGNAYKDTIS